MIVIVDTGGANIASIMVALNRLSYDAELSIDSKKIKNASHIILPGVGSAQEAMPKLQSLGLVEVIGSLKQPVLGICLGMQLLYDYSEEGDLACLGLISGSVEKLSTANNIKVPHMGWNSISLINSCPLLKDIQMGDFFYFVHSYAKSIVSQEAKAMTEYGRPFVAVCQKDNFFGTQFHPEKSGHNGVKILRNFLGLK